MRKPLFTATFALAAIAGLVGGDGFSSPPELLPPPGPVSEAASPPAPGSAAPGMPSGVVPESQPLSAPGGVDANLGWTCGPPRCFWLSGEYLLWWIKDSQLPPLVTTTVAGTTAYPGVLGQQGTTGLYGGSTVDSQVRSGGRFSGGFWLNDSHTIGLGASYFFLGSRSVSFNDVSNGGVIARPFFDVLTGLENAQLVAYPGIASGQIHVSSPSTLQGAELNMLAIPCCTCCNACVGQSCPSGNKASASRWGGSNYWVYLLAGVCYLQLDEGLDITESSQVNPNLPAGSPLYGGSTIAIGDHFDTHNYFYGGQLGAQAEFCWGPVFVDVLGKVALGMTQEVVDIHGTTAITSPGGVTVTTPAGFLASGSNSGQFTRDVFAVIPQVGINAGCQITSHCRAFVGYTFLYWSAVARPGDQVDMGLSGTQIPTDTRYNPQAGPARPAVPLQGTDFWAQGISLGLMFRY